MNPELAFEIVDLALSLVRSPEQSVADTLLQIVERAYAAYYDHTGKPIDPFLIQPEELV